jgi:hypothetical protein
MRYFSNFPIISYANNSVKNIFARVRIDKKVKEYSNSFYPYDLEAGDRPDVVSYAYYEDPYNDWMIYFANDVLDPYYDYYLDQNQFNSLIQQKYGSIANAQLNVYGYRNNWYSDETVLTIAAYDGLSSNLKKYWDPVIGYSGVITGYQRAKLDTIITTNKVTSLSISLTGNTTFKVGERVQQSQITNGLIPSANAFVSFANTSTVIVQHVDGGFIEEDPINYVLTGRDTGATAAVISETTLKQNIPIDEVIYYSPYSFYDYEEELNQQKNRINLIDNRYSSTIERQLRQLLSE